MKPRTLSCAAVLAAALFGCELPPVAPGLDEYSCPADGGPCVLPAAAGVIQGTVVYSGVRRGDTILLLFASNNLPPPDGTATTAVSLARVPAAKLFGNSGGSGPFSAPYVFTQVRPGTYQIRAFIDVTGEFDPFFDFTQQPRAGDPVGGHVAFDNQGVPHLADFTVESGITLTGVNVALGQELAFDPPSFKVKDGSPTVFAQNIDRPQVLVLESVNLGLARVDFPNAKFAVELNRGSDGLAVASDGDGLVDVFPQVLLRQIDEVSENGSILPVSPADAAIIPAKMVPMPVLPLLLARSAQDAPLALDHITVLVQPFAVQLRAPVPGVKPVPVPLRSIPAGSYQIVVIEKSGQVWTVPNSLGTRAPGAALYAPSQATKIVFQQTPGASGSISGKVHYPVGRTPGNLILQAFRGGAALAPPLSAALPTRVKLIPKRFLLLDETRSIEYTIDALPAGKYVIEALDDEDGNFSPLNLLQTPTKGDLIGGALDQTGHLLPIDVVQSPVTGQDVNLVAPPLALVNGQPTPIDPPAFSIDESVAPAQLAQDARGTVRFTVKAAPIAFPAGAGDVQTTFFTVGLVKDDVGHPVDSDGDGLPDVWPRAFLVKLDDADPTGLTPADPTVALPAAIDPTPFLPALLAAGAPSAISATRLSIVVRPAALDVRNPAAPARLPVIPAGRYKIVLMNKTGQVWQIPNEAGTAALDPRAVCGASGCTAGQVSTAGQSGAFKVVSPSAPVPPGEIDGTLTVAGTGPAFVGAYLFAFAAADPPPPLGTGRPVSADFHSSLEFTTPSGTSNRVVNYALRGLAAGDYYVTAVIDGRGDFALDPFFSAAAPGPGSLPGAHLDAQGHLLKVTVSSAVPVAGVGVGADPARAFPARPSFNLADANGNPLGADAAGLLANSTVPMRLKLVAAPVLGHGVAVETLAIQLGTSVLLKDQAETSAAFPVTIQCDAAGNAVDADFDNLPDLYPQIRLVKLSPDDPLGLLYDTSSGGLIAIPAAIDPTPFLGPAAGSLSCAGTRTVVKTELPILVSPAAVRQTALGIVPLPSIPPGRYGVVVISGTGQVWRIPNELQPALLDPRTPAAIAAQLAPQALAFGVGAAASIPGGAIQGQIQLTGYTSTTVGGLLVGAYRASDPPPPAGTGRPVAVQYFPKPLVQLAAQAGVQPYRLVGLPADTYLVAAMHDPLGRFSPLLSYLASPGLGAQVALLGGSSTPTPIPVAATTVTAPAALALDAAGTRALPFERPMFGVDAAFPALMPSSESAPVPLQLHPETPDALPFGLVSLGGNPVVPHFHPMLVLGAGGAPVKGPDGRFTVTTRVLLTPLAPPGAIAAIASIDPRPFCGQLVSGADSECTTGTPIVNGGQPAIAQVDALLLGVVPNLSYNLVLGAVQAGRPPSGSYRMTVLESTGQSWSVPNELATSIGATGLQQGAVYQVQ